MKLTSAIVLAAVFAAIAAAQPVVSKGGVVNAASYALPGMPNAGVAQGAMFIVFGQRMGPATLQQVNAFPLPTAQGLGGTSIKVTVGGVTKDAIMIYTSANQVAAILPSDVPVGDGTLTVTYNGQTSAPEAIKVVQSAFGMFTRNQAGSGPAIVQNFVSQTDQPVNALTVAAGPGQVVTLWGTGLGPVTGELLANEAARPIPGDLNIPVEVYVGGKPALVRYKGRSGCCAGIDQIVFDVPAGVEGCYAPVVLKVNGVISNFGSISVAANGRKVCSDPTGLSEADLQRIEQVGSDVRFGTVLLSRTGLKFSAGGFGDIVMNTDMGSASFARYQAQNFMGSTGAFSLASIGSCLVTTSREEQPSGDPMSLTATPLDAGTAITVNGPKGQKQLTRPTNIKGLYTAQLSGAPPAGQPYLDPGQYAISGPGGADVGAFSTTLTIPSLLNWTNQDSINSVPRGQGLQVTWTGGDANGFVQIVGSSTSGVDTTATFVCTERASAGQFTVPAVVLSAMPVSAVQDETPQGFLMVGSSGAPVRFNATGLDFGYALYTTLSGKNVKFE